MSRIAPASPPYPSGIQSRLNAIMPRGVPPPWLFHVLARDARLFQRFMAGGLLDRGHLTLREREIVILRVCANHRSEYEWGVHVAFFASKVGLAQAELAATLGREVAEWWSARERLLLRMCDELSTRTTLSDSLWMALSSEFTPEALLELLLLNGLYRTILTLTHTLQMPLETFATRFAQVGA
jgi:alkylhydroperoxidase family enzyme